jgi:hypothetical protein
MATVSTPDELVRWAVSAKPNARVSYFRGYLFRERIMNPPSRREGANAAPHFKTASKAWEMSQIGIVRLFQKRVDDEDYIYIAVKA